MKILAIESSADETGAAVVENGIHILSNSISSSLLIHNITGGIIPETAAREQIKFIIPVLQQALKPLIKSTTSTEIIKIIQTEIDSIAVTIGPGLIGSLLVGVESAKTLAYVTNKPLIPVNHIFAHLYANWLEQSKTIEFPAIGLIVSGGHTELFLIKNHGSWKWLGGTRDDAAGEAFDKTARLLGLGYPGGPAIAEIAKRHTEKNRVHIHLPRPLNDQSLDFSFSGLKSAVMREIQNLKKNNVMNAEAQSSLAYELQESITDVLVSKTILAAKLYRPKSILVGGGVAANSRLKEKLTKTVIKEGLDCLLFIPPPSLCTDNAAAIGSFAFFCGKPSSIFSVNAYPDFEVEV